MDGAGSLSQFRKCDDSPLILIRMQAHDSQEFEYFPVDVGTMPAGERVSNGN